MKELTARIKFLIYDRDFEIVYDSNTVINSLDSLRKVFDMLEDDYVDECVDQENKWTTTKEITMEDINKKFPPIPVDESHKKYNWYDNIANKEDFEKKC